MNYKSSIVYIATSLVIFAVLTTVFKKPEKKKYKPVNEKAAELIQNLKHGDVILVNSDDFFSRVVRSVDGCEASSFKLAINFGGQTDLLISDADSLVDNTQGLRTVRPEDYFQEYDTLRIKILRPHSISSESNQVIINYLQRMSKETVSYDFSFFKNTQKKLTCEKLLYTIYPYSFESKGMNHFYYNGLVPCEFQIDRFQVITPEWVSYFKK